MGRRKLGLLIAEEDRKTFEPYISALSDRGIDVSDPDTASGNTMVLAVLSESFYKNEEAVDTLLKMIGMRAETILPVQLDSVKIPDKIKDGLYSRNIIPAAGREVSLTADRIADAVPVPPPVITPKLFIIAGILLVIGISLLLWIKTRPDDTITISDPEVDNTIITMPAGITEEDLAAIREVLIIGEEFRYYTDADSERPTIYDFAIRTGNEDGDQIDISKEDGHVYSMTHYDLRFLEMMPNLEYLFLCNVEVGADEYPDFPINDRLVDVSLTDCNIDTLEWLKGTNIESFDIHNTQVIDYSPLTSCVYLTYAHIDLYRMTEADFSGFHPYQLNNLLLVNGDQLDEIDLSELRHTYIESLRVERIPLKDLDFLKSIPRLKFFSVGWCNDLEDISGVENLKMLDSLEIMYCPRITDYSPIGGCISLERIQLQCDENPEALRDASFLAGLTHLNNIGIYGASLHDLDFLEGISEHSDRIHFGFAGEIGDYSGLAYIKEYEYLHINPRFLYDDRERGGDFSAVLPYIRDADISHLILCSCGDVDLSPLPTGIRTLEIWHGNLTNLQGLNLDELKELKLQDCMFLTSLSGLEEDQVFFNGAFPDLSIINCPRLTDYSALEGMQLECLDLNGQYILPDFGTFHTKILKLENMPELTELSCLDTIDSNEKVNIHLIGLDNLTDLSVLSGLRGDKLVVPPQVADQAAELIESGNFNFYVIEYPENGWEPDNSPVRIYSLDDINTLSPSMLSRVEYLTLVGDTVVNTDNGCVEEVWEEGAEKPVYVFHSYETDEYTPIEYGEGITDISVLSDLTGLNGLELIDQPLENLSGVQNMFELDSFSARWCPNLTDVSAVFACPEITNLNFRGSPVESIQGVQNLYNLVWLDINGTNVTDLSPLEKVDYSVSESQDGFSLNIGYTQVEDLIPIMAIPKFALLEIGCVDPSLYIDLLDDALILRYSADSAYPNDEADQLFAEFISRHHELTEVTLFGNPGITDLTPLLDLDGLELVRLGGGEMQEAVDSLGGTDYRFVLDYQH